jgi:hypothetical protein
MDLNRAKEAMSAELSYWDQDGPDPQREQTRKDAYGFSC